MPAAVARYVLLHALPLVSVYVILVIVASICLEVRHRESSKSGLPDNEAPSRFPPAESAVGHMIRLVVCALLMLQARLRTAWLLATSYRSGVLIGWPLAGVIMAFQVRNEQLYFLHTANHDRVCLRPSA